MQHPWGRSGAAAVALGLLVAACTPGAVDDVAGVASPTGAPQVGADGLVGPLCPMLPSGDEPGNPAFLEELPPDEALTWIPVATIFEAGIRASGLDSDLAAADGLTILVPSDDTFDETFSEATLDDLLLHRTGELRTLLEAHIVEGMLSLAQLADRGSVTTLAGTTIAVDGDPGGVEFDDAGGVLCGDYRVTGARIHVIGAVLGDLPEPAADDEDAH